MFGVRRCVKPSEKPPPQSSQCSFVPFGRIELGLSMLIVNTDSENNPKRIFRRPLPFAPFQLLDLTAVVFGRTAFGVGRTDAGCLIEQLLLFALCGHFFVFTVQKPRFGSGAALVV